MMIGIKKAVCLIMIMAALFAGMLLVSCGQADGEAKKDEDVRIEEGWTIKDDGSAYTYAVVIENTTEDKIIMRADVSVDALDPDGNVIEKREGFKGVYYSVGPIWPGKKGAVVMSYSEISPDGRGEWVKTPSGFSIKASVTQKMSLDSSGEDDLEKKSPDIEVVSAEEIYNDGETAEYMITLKNNGKYDCEADRTGGNGPVPDVYAVFRNEDGEITGAGASFIETAGDIMMFPAGEEISEVIYIYDIPPGEPEFFFNWQ